MSGLRTRSLFAGFALLALALPLAAANQVANGDFDTDATPWTTVPGGDGAISWDTRSASCPDTSGSGFGANFGGSPAPYTSFHQCVTGIVAGQSYVFGARFFFPSTETPAASSYVKVFWMQSAGCTTSLGSTDSNPLSPAPLDTWRDTRGVGIAPPNTLSADIYLSVGHTGSPNPGNLLIDEVYLQPLSEVFQNGFELGTACRWSAVVP